GYRWYAQKNQKPMYAFGHGLSYTTFSYGDLKASGGETITATFTVTNTGKVVGAEVPPVYLTETAGGKSKRLVGLLRRRRRAAPVAHGQDRGRSAAARALRWQGRAVAHRRRRASYRAGQERRRPRGDVRGTADSARVREVTMRERRWPHSRLSRWPGPTTTEA